MEYIYLFKEHSELIEGKLFKDGYLKTEDLVVFGEKTTDILGVDMMPFVDYIVRKHRTEKTAFKLYYLEVPNLLSRWTLAVHEEQLNLELNPPPSPDTQARIDKEEES